MKVLQLLPTISYGDAIGNETLALNDMLHQFGYDTGIYAENIDSRIKHADVKHYSVMPEMAKNDIVLYHFSTGCKALCEVLQKISCRKIMIFHNITPAKYFSGYNAQAEQLVENGKNELISLKDIFDICWADSSYNKKVLQEVGYACPIEVLPILIPFYEYEREADVNVFQKYSEENVKNFLFVGRIAPNKKQEDIIRAFAYYHKFVDEETRLFLVGNPNGMEPYFQRLKRYVAELGIEESVIFTGHTSFSEILAYYRLADVFLCMSEHEGFCVPIIEAMKFKIPVIAYAEAAVPETVGGGGVLLSSKSLPEIASVLHIVFHDDHMREMIREGQQKRLEDLSYTRVMSLAKRYLDEATCDSLGLAKNNVDKCLNDIERENEEHQNKIQEYTAKKMQYVMKNISLDETVLSYEKISIQDGLKRESMSGRTRIKKYILKPAFEVTAALSPRFAQMVRSKLYAWWHRWKKKEYHIGKMPMRKAALLVDVTQITRSDGGTGIQRVVKNVYRELKKLRGNDALIPLQNTQGNPTTSYQFESAIGLCAPRSSEKGIEICEGDILFLLDSSWEYSGPFRKLIDEVHSKHGKVFGLVHDLFPIQHPEWFPSAYFRTVFTQWHDMLCIGADGIICNSHVTADNLARYVCQKRLNRSRSLNLYVFPMGVKIPKASGKTRKEIQDFFGEKRKTFLMVGTVEPRKGHALVFDAFQHILCTRDDCQLLIIGRDGWGNSEFQDRLRGSQALKKHVLWIKDASDAELLWAYRHASALIAASTDEGFGLPLIEAAKFRVPIIASDIPIFKEVAQKYADYFQVNDVSSLTNCLIKWLNEKNHPDSGKIMLYTWRDSAQAIWEILQGNGRPYKVIREDKG